MGAAVSRSQAERALARHFLEHSGYVRSQSRDRRTALGSSWFRTYKKGWEVRLPVEDEAEAEQLGTWLAAAGYSPGKTWLKGAQLIVPLYGREQVERFLAMVDSRAGTRRR